MDSTVEELERILRQPENELLLRCMSVHLDLEGISRIRSLVDSSPDWNYIVNMAAAHKVIPLVYSTLNTHCPELASSTMMIEMERHFKVSGARSTLLAIELIRLLKAFEASLLPILCFKGPALAMSVYGNLALRRSDDLDFLVKEQDITLATEILAKSGYTPIGSDDLQPGPLRYHLAFLHPQTKIIVEMHWKLAPPYLYFPLQFDEIWQRTTTVNLLGSQLRIFSSEDMLMTLAVHGAKHNWKILNWLCDVSELTTSSKELDWNYLLQRAEALHCKRMLLLSLSLVGQLFDVPLAETIRQAIVADHQLPSLQQQVLAWIFTSPSIQIDFEGYAFQIKARDSLLDKARYIKIKQPMMDPNAADPSQLPIPHVDRQIYYVLRFTRWVRLRCYRPVKSLFASAREQLRKTS